MTPLFVPETRLGFWFLGAREWLGLGVQKPGEREETLLNLVATRT